MAMIRHVDLGSHGHAPLTFSETALARMLSLPREPLFIGDWLNVVMIHLEVDAGGLQAATPFTLDLWEGRAFVTLVAFTLRGMRPRFGGRVGEMLFKPLATHRFLNVRTYVRHGDEPGIHFLAEWLDNWLAVKLGPRVFGLPYRLGRLAYQNEWRRGELCGCVEDAGTGAELVYRARAETGAPGLAPCKAGSFDEWLMERYTAFNGTAGGASIFASRRHGKFVNEARGDARPTGYIGRRRFFRVWHEPWSQRRIGVRLEDQSLLARAWPFFREAKLAGANYSPGLQDVWMGWPHALQGETEPCQVCESVPDSCEVV